MIIRENDLREEFQCPLIFLKLSFSLAKHDPCYFKRVFASSLFVEAFDEMHFASTQLFNDLTEKITKKRLDDVTFSSNASSLKLVRHLS